MAFNGFDGDDFDVFAIPEFEPRMDTLREQITPKLRALGDILVPFLEEETGLEFYSHVATHARRRVNPAEATWVALGPNSRGYKRYVHFEVGVELDGAYVDVVLKPESEDKKTFAREIRRRGPALLEQANAGTFDVVWREAHGGDGQILDRQLGSITEQDLQALYRRLTSVKRAQVDIGVGIERDDPALKSADAFVDAVKGRLTQLMPLYTAAIST